MVTEDIYIYIYIYISWVHVWLILQCMGHSIHPARVSQMNRTGVPPLPVQGPVIAEKARKGSPMICQSGFDSTVAL